MTDINFVMVTSTCFDEEMMKKLGNYITGKWIEGDGDDWVTVVAECSNARTPTVPVIGKNFELFLQEAVGDVHQ